MFSFILGLFLIFGFYTFSSKLKNQYLLIKNEFTTDDKYLAVITENGLWIRDEINGTIKYTGNKQIIVEAINLDNDLIYREFLDSDKFLFDKLTPGNYNIFAFEHLNKVTMEYFSGRLEPLELAAKYVEYNKDVAVRANWKNTINMEIK